MTDMSVVNPGVTETDRVRSNTPDSAIREIDRDGRQCVETFAGADPESIRRHIDQLDREWDIERILQTNMSIIALGGVLLSATVSRKFMLLPGVVLGFFLQHAVQGWCPPVPAFRRMGVRTRKEINREKYALKALRGDLDQTKQT